ncbi:MAG TPA: MAPEG family protein [Myxococcota bacterium]
MELVAIVAALALLEYLAFVLICGHARGRYGVAAPATTGNAVFERAYRVQMNTLEQLVVFLPALLLFAVYVSEPWAAALGVLFVLGRALYAHRYLTDPARRGPGFGLTLLANLLLLVGGLIGAIVALM